MKILILFVFLSMLGCGGFQSSSDSNKDSQDKQSDEGNAVPPPVNLKICTKLDLSNIFWPDFFEDFTRNSFATALNITSSFEGRQSWSAIAGDFDQMGLSLGLLQQNLGSQTLQPLLIKLKIKSMTKMKSFFKASHFTSLNNMLEDWMDNNSLSSQEEDLFRNDEDQISDLDGSDEAEGMEFLSAMAVNPSVQWARNNILDSGNLKSDWKAEFQAMAASQDYKNLQFKEALKLHVKTEEYRRTFGFSSLKAYLFLFDIVVQNGGFKKSHLKSYLDYLKTTPSAGEMKNLAKLLEIRLTSVRSQYKNDVSSRKMTILTGSGVVHGQSRNLSKEYCYDQELNLGPVQNFDGQFLQ